MKRKVLASLMAIGLLFNGFAVQAAGNEACDHTNIHSFDTTTRSVRLLIGTGWMAVRHYVKLHTENTSLPMCVRIAGQ